MVNVGSLQCWLRDRGAAALGKPEGSQCPCRATGHGCGLGRVGLRAVRSYGWCGVEGGEELRVVRSYGWCGVEGGEELWVVQG